jgi:hypothetical protein
MEEDFNAWQNVVLVEEDMAHLARVATQGVCRSVKSPVCVASHL